MKIAMIGAAGGAGAAGATGPTGPTGATGAGTASPLTTKGDLWGFTTVNARVGIGSDGQVLTADAASAPGLKWATGSGGGVSLSAANTWTGVQTFGTIGGAVSKFALAGSTSGSVVIDAPAVAGTTTLVTPGISGTLAALNGTNVWTGSQAFADGTFGLSGSGSGLSTIKSVTGITGNFTLPNSNSGVQLSGVTASTAGYVPFNSGTAGVFSANANLFWDSSNSILGVGTASPDATASTGVHVKKTANNPARMIVETTSTGTSANASLYLWNSTGAGGTGETALFLLSTGYTPSGLLIANSAWLYTASNALNLCTASSGKPVVIAAGGLASANEIARFDPTSGVTIKSGVKLQLGNAATTGLTAGVLAATTNATVTLTDSTGTTYRIPCIV